MNPIIDATKKTDSASPRSDGVCYRVRFRIQTRRRCNTTRLQSALPTDLRLAHPVRAVPSAAFGLSQASIDAIANR